MSSVSLLQRILEPLNNTFPKAKCTTPLYLPGKMGQTQTMAANKCEGTLKKKKTFTKNSGDVILFCCDFRVSSMTRFTNLFSREFLRIYHFKSDTFSMPTSKTPEDFLIAFPKMRQISINLREAEFCDSIHHVSD